MQLSILAKIIDMLFPRICPVCGNRLAGEEESICMSCNLHLPRTDTWESPYENEMAKIFWHQIPIEKCCALFYFQSHSLSSNIIYKLKYHHRPDIAFDMGRLLAQEGIAISFFDDIDGIIPIPLAKKRKRQRGYNQSEEIAKGISSLTHLPIHTDIVKRNTFKESQTHKDRLDRASNVAQVFELTQAYKEANQKSDNLKDKHYLIIDDVCTTGATIISCCHAIMNGTPNSKNMKFSVLSIGWAKR